MNQKLSNPSRGTLCLRKSVCLLAALGFFTHQATAQKAIHQPYILQSVGTSGLTYDTTAAPGAHAENVPAGTYNYRFGTNSGFTDNRKELKAFTADKKRYAFITTAAPVVKVQRKVAEFEAAYKAAYPGGYATPMEREIGYYEGTINTSTKRVNIKTRYISKLEDMLIRNDVGVGLDNVFANASGLVNPNNVERIDVTYPTGYLVTNPAIQGFGIFERGTPGNHDSCVVAVITAVDPVTGNPTAFYTKLIRIVAANYEVPGLTPAVNSVYQGTTGYVILRHDRAERHLQASDIALPAQGTAGVMMKFSDFGIAPGATVYGYTVLPIEFWTLQSTTGALRDQALTNGTAATRALDISSNTYFPNNTSDAAGGIDLATIAGIVQTLKISGTVYNDVNGLKDALIDGPAPGITLYAVLTDASNKVIESVPVNTTTGAFTFSNNETGSLSVKLSTTNPADGTTFATGTLPAGWVSVGADYGQNNSAGTGTLDNSATGAVAVTLGNTDITGIKFAIEQLPTAGSGTYNAGENPGGTTLITVPATTFTSTANSTDPAPGAVASIRIPTFPSGASSVVIGGNTYSNAGVWPGVIVATDANGAPTETIQVDPSFDGADTVTFSFIARDAAGRESTNTGKAQIFFTTTIAGHVYNDANGTTDNLVNATGSNQTIPTGLSAVLTNAGGQVLATQPLTISGSTASFSFPGLVKGQYGLCITSNTATVGQPAPATALPAGWYYAGQKNCGATAGCTGTDGAPSGMLSLGTVSLRISEANFGIERAPVADAATAAIPNPAVNSERTLDGASAGLPVLTATDPEDGVLDGTTASKTLVINTLPTNGQLFYNGAALTTSGFEIASFDQSKLKFRFTGSGYTATQFTYSFKDAAGIASAPAAYQISWDWPLPVHLISFEAQAKGNAALLRWTTGSEANSKGFGIERSSDGAGWSSAGYVNSRSHGATTTGFDYEYLDEQPGSGVRYYRLFLEDVDGTATYSPVRRILLQNNGQAVSIFPTPAHQTLTVSGANIISVRITDVQGRQLQAPATKTGTDNWVLQTGQLADGLYFLQLTYLDGTTQSERIVIQH